MLRFFEWALFPSKIIFGHAWTDGEPKRHESWNSWLDEGYQWNEVNKQMLSLEMGLCASCNLIKIYSLKERETGFKYLF